MTPDSLPLPFLSQQPTIYVMISFGALIPSPPHSMDHMLFAAKSTMH